MKKYHILTYGCQMNYADSERFASMLNQSGMEKSVDLNDADLIIINTCSVRQKAEDRIIGLGRKLAPLKNNNNKLKIILTGCMARRKWQDNKNTNDKIQKKYFAKLFKDMPWLDEIVETRDFPKFIEKNKIKEFFDYEPTPTDNIHALVPISFGCNHFCTYCIVPYSRGKEECRRYDDIKKEFNLFLKKGFKDITLLGQTVNRWINPDFKDEYKINSVAAVKIPDHNCKHYCGEGEPKDFLQLLEDLDSSPGEYWISFISSHPNYMTKEIVDFMARSKHIKPYFHFALQSGSDRILSAMNRRHKLKDFIEIAEYYKSKMPEATLSTDIIVGFPGETEKDFDLTAQAMKKIGFDAAYISEFSLRKGTPAALVKDNVPREIKAKRKAYLNDEILAKTALKNNKKLIGKIFKCLIEKTGLKFSMGRLENNKEIRISRNYSAGTFLNVKIISCTPWALEGKVLI